MVQTSETSITKAKPSMNFVGLVGPAKAWKLAELARSHKKVLFVAKNKSSAESIFEDLTLFTRGLVSPLLLGSWDTLPFEPVSPDPDTTARRLNVFQKVMTGESSLVVTSAESLLLKVAPPKYIKERSWRLIPGQVIDREKLQKFLTAIGFRRTAIVDGVGQYSIRGGVIDVFPAGTSSPIRLSFDDRVLERIRAFDIDTQRSTHDCTESLIYPVREIIDPQWLDEHGISTSALVDQVRLRGEKLEVPLRETVKTIHYLQSGAPFPGIELIQPMAGNALVSALSYFTPDTAIILDDFSELQIDLEQYSNLIDERESRFKEGHILHSKREQLYVSSDSLLEEFKTRTRFQFNDLKWYQGEDDSTDTMSIHTRFLTDLHVRIQSKEEGHQPLEPLIEALNTWNRDGYGVAIVVGSESRAERISSALKSTKLVSRKLQGSLHSWIDSPKRTPLVFIEGHLSKGFELTDSKIVFVSESDIFRERSYRTKARRSQSLKRIMTSLSQLSEGDLIVHVDYGIGKYVGLRTVSVEGKETDFLHIEYADSRLYLPVQHIGKIQKFIAGDDESPLLDKLSSNRWFKTKQKVRESVLELAGDLIKLYAKRNVVNGWQYDRIGEEDEIFADGFPYDETPDQLKAIEETLSDMASVKPMDRLVCGDVGFGKTEVALRAAFKCAQAGRQVAVLVPTTILVEQHRQTFVERFVGFDVEVGALSRFYSAKQNKETLERLASGKVGVVIGTHKLLGRGVQFKDLGLLVIDEEHRFGVKQKERLKQLRTQVEVLSLTATPIPRTLHMSLVGIRDVSVITTPPTDRRVIKTYVAHNEETIIRDAIMRELRRGGQSFYVHNRIEGISVIVDELRHLVPEARIEYGHGQMPEKQIEDVMRRFTSKEIDVLVSTAIVESGLDIPNANTMIIDRADMFGLAQLYQLRGRVGRSSRQAYCYFLVPKAKRMSLEAQQRLKALQALDDLGLGFHLALRDMEIRGAGNLLGKEQSGQVAAVGFELYSKILKEAIAHLKGEAIDLNESIDPEVKLGIDAFIPEFYIPDVSERLMLYQRLSQVVSDEDGDALLEEMEDRFGPPPLEAKNFVIVMKFRALLKRIGVMRAEVSKNKLHLALSKDARFDSSKILNLVKSNPNRYRFSQGLILTVQFVEGEMEPNDIPGFVEELLGRIR